MDRNKIIEDYKALIFREKEINEVSRNEHLKNLQNLSDKDLLKIEENVKMASALEAEEKNPTRKRSFYIAWAMLLNLISCLILYFIFGKTRFAIAQGGFAMFMMLQFAFLLLEGAVFGIIQHYNRDAYIWWFSKEV